MNSMLARKVSARCCLEGREDRAVDDCVMRFVTNDVEVPDLRQVDG